MKEREQIERIYGQEHQEHYDQFFWKSKAKKNKEKQEKTQRNATISLTHNQSAKVAQEAKAATFKAQAEQYRALAAQKAAETANTVLEGAKATVNLKNTAIAIGVVFILGGVALAMYAMRENKKSAQLKADELILNGSPTPDYKQ